MLIACWSCKKDVPPKENSDFSPDTINILKGGPAANIDRNKKYPAKGFAEYKITSVKKTYGNEKDSKNGYASIELEYPVFKNITSKEVGDIIKYYIDKYIFYTVKGKSAAPDPEKYVEQYFNDYKEYKKDCKDTTEFFQWELKKNVTVDFCNDKLICLGFYIYHDIGEMHFNTELEYKVFDIRSGAEITLNDIFKYGYENKLNTIAERLFRKLKNLSKDADMSETEWFYLTDGKFELNDNYAVTDKGIVFYYNRGEMASWSDGTTKLLIPYNEIKNLLNSDYFPLSK